MADTEKIIKIIFEGVNNVSGVVSDMRTAFVDNIQKPLAAISDSVIDLDKKLALLAAGGLAYSFHEAVKLESAVVGLDKVLSEQEQKLLPNLVSRMEEFGGAFGQTTAEAVNSAAEFRKASFELEASAHLAELASKLVIGASEANFQMGRSTETLISILKGFRVAEEDIVNESIHFADVFNKFADEYATTVGELTNGLTILAPISESLGFSFDEMAGFLIPVVEVFGSGSESANGLKTSLLSLADPTSELTKTLSAYGIELKKANGEQKNVKEILDELLPVYNGLSKAQQVQIASMIAGKDQAAKFTALLNGMETALNATAIAATEAGGSLDKELARGLGTAEVQIQRAIASFRDLAAQIGAQFKDAGKNTIEGATEINLALKSLVREGAFDDILNLVEDAGNELGDLLKEIAKNLPDAFEDVDFGGLVASLEEFKSVVLSTFDIDISTTEGLAEAIQLVVNAFESLVNVSTGIYDAFKPYIEGIIEAIQKSDELSAQSERTFGKIAGIAGLMGEIGVALGGVVTALNQAGISIEGIFDILAGSSKTVINFIQSIFDAFLKSILLIADKVLGLAELIDKINPFEGLSDKIKNARQSLDELSEANLYSFTQNIKEAASGATQALEGFDKKIVDTSDRIKKVPDEKRINLYWNQDTFDKALESAKKSIKEELPIDSTATLGVKVEGIDDAKESVIEITDTWGFLKKTISDTSPYDSLELFEDKLTSIDGEIDYLTSRKRQIEIDLLTGDGDEGLYKELLDIENKIEALTEEKIQVQIDMEPARREIAAATNDLKTMSDIIVKEIGGETYIEFIGEVNKDSIDKIEETKKKLSEDKEFLFKIESKELEEDTKRIEKQLDVFNDIATTKLKLDAEIDVEKIKAELRKFDTIVENTSDLIQGLSDSTNDLFGQFEQDLDLRSLWLLQEQIRQNIRIQREEFELQKKSIELQIEKQKLQNDLLRDPTKRAISCTIDQSFGPAFEWAVREFLSKIRIWGTEYDFAQLVEVT